VTGTREEETMRVSAVVGMEARLADKLSEAADEVAHTECFDQEQRAEIYTILQAMKADAEAHRNIVGRWVNERTGEVHDV